MTVISNVTPSSNQGNFLEEIIQSALLQHGDFFIDCIIMDGGSRGTPAEIIEKDGLNYYDADRNDFP